MRNWFSQRGSFLSSSYTRISSTMSVGSLIKLLLSSISFQKPLSEASIRILIKFLCWEVCHLSSWKIRAISSLFFLMYFYHSIIGPEDSYYLALVMVSIRDYGFMILLTLYFIIFVLYCHFFSLLQHWFKWLLS